MMLPMQHEDIHSVKVHGQCTPVAGAAFDHLLDWNIIVTVVVIINVAVVVIDLRCFNFHEAVLGQGFSRWSVLLSQREQEFFGLSLTDFLNTGV